METILILKSLHLISLVAWFAGLFYLPRLFVYHTTAPKEAYSMLCTMEKKLLRYITTPAAIATILTGAGLVHFTSAWQGGGWFHAKLLLVFILLGYHHSLSSFAKKFAKNHNTRSEKFFRIYNELPTILLVIIIFLVVLKPF